jgi:hypothetical protein
MSTRFSMFTTKVSLVHNSSDVLCSYLCFSLVKFRNHSTTHYSHIGCPRYYDSSYSLLPCPSPENPIRCNSKSDRSSDSEKCQILVRSECISRDSALLTINQIELSSDCCFTASNLNMIHVNRVNLNRSPHSTRWSLLDQLRILEASICGSDEGRAPNPNACIIHMLDRESTEISLGHILDEPCFQKCRSVKPPGLLNRLATLKKSKAYSVHVFPTVGF